MQNVRSGRVEQTFIHEPGATYAAVFDPTGEYVFVSGAGAGTIWRVSDGRQWLTVEDRMGDYYGGATPQNPFVPASLAASSRGAVTHNHKTVRIRRTARGGPSPTPKDTDRGRTKTISDRRMIAKMKSPLRFAHCLRTSSITLIGQRSKRLPTYRYLGL